MEDIKSEEYIRTKQGTIARVSEEEFEIFYNGIGQVSYKHWIGKECRYEPIVKHSSNLIDLIEEGDYVNGVRILDVTGDYIHTAEYDCCKERLSKKLKSIVTHEQFKSIEYRVETEKKK